MNFVVRRELVVSFLYFVPRAELIQQKVESFEHSLCSSADRDYNGLFVCTVPVRIRWLGVCVHENMLKDNNNNVVPEQRGHHKVQIVSFLIFTRSLVTHTKNKNVKLT